MTEQELRQYLMGSPKENEAATNRHVMNDAWFKQRDDALARNDLPKSGFNVSMKKVRAKIQNKLRSGDFKTFKTRGEARAILDLDESVGIVYYKVQRGKIEHQPTRALMVSCSRTEGYHFYPTPERGDVK